jgi:predicted amidophosphoribosyltransferase
MGHLIFFIIHVAAYSVYAPALLLSIALHLIYAAMTSTASATQKTQPSRWTHVLCPDCREPVLHHASVCKHCGAKLTPQPKPGWFD